MVSAIGPEVDTGARRSVGIRVVEQGHQVKNLEDAGDDACGVNESKRGTDPLSGDVTLKDGTDGCRIDEGDLGKVDNDSLAFAISDHAEQYLPDSVTRREVRLTRRCTRLTRTPSV